MAEEQQNLEQLTQDIINRFEEVLGQITTSELSTKVANINQSLEKHESLVKNISAASANNLKTLSSESKTIKSNTSDIAKQSKLYSDILSFNEEISQSWSKIVKQSANTGKNYDDINKKQKQYISNLKSTEKQEKKITDLTLKRKKATTSNGKKGGLPQFVNPAGLASTQIGIESLTGGKPYFASHPELGVPVGLFNTKDEPNRSARIKAINKYGTGGSMGGVFPQYADTDAQNVANNRPTNEDVDILKGTGYVVLKEAVGYFKTIGGIVEELVGVGNQFADKFLEFTSSADESIRNSIQNAGILMKPLWNTSEDTPLSRADDFRLSMEQAVKELNENEGIKATMEDLAELQKSFTEASKSNVLVRKDDLKNLIYLKTLFGLTGSELGELQSSFVDLGMTSKDVKQYTTDLYNDANEAGLSVSKLSKDTAKLMKSGMLYRFKGGIKDMEKMQIYAANAKLSIDQAYSIMDKGMTIEGATEFAAQLQNLGGAFTSFNALEFASKSMAGDTQGVIEMIGERLRADTSAGLNRFGTFDDKGNFQMGTAGRAIVRGFESTGQLGAAAEITTTITQLSKEGKIRSKIMNSDLNRANFLQLGTDVGNKIVTKLAKGTFQTVDETLSKTVNFANDVLNSNDNITDITAELVAGQQSIKEKEELTKNLVALQSQNAKSFNAASEGLLSLRSNLITAGDAIARVGMQVLKDDYFKKIQVLTDNLGLSVTEAIAINKMLSSGAFSSGVIAMLDLLNAPSKILDVINPFSQTPSSAPTAMSQSSKGVPNSASAAPIVETGFSNKALGGILRASGGLVNGPSHINGGVRGTGRFNNIEVEGGEAIINKNSTSMFLPLLSKLNEIGGGNKLTSAGVEKLDSISTANDKTINVKINGKLDYITNLNIPNLNIVELAKSIQGVTDGTTYDGAY